MKQSLVVKEISKFVVIDKDWTNRYDTNKDNSWRINTGSHNGVGN